ncbi:uncharacterized protein NCU08274 [Neurospora crassa OR74A]|uniref:Hydrophobin n=1 Tax=Neurospora crassa (strain ATCC 24698 / 74-OR23-1A / CBS 708.71 / DSM 1257 / FGSC 987) TaxID=367110 RepID=V5IMG8_NEUCR|nr:uncharacterized protein NCU08274 [Neurospora crassa OR74A]ESA42887.1 hypothetical protein, variant [Neurospora crassa OR74A]|eukprot:XP_011394294.1 uncharacterized protein NCU08274 [Neurospora crassa OR74A]
MRFSFLYFGLAVPAMGILVPPTHENLSPGIEGNTFDGKTTCPRGTNTYCCDSLDYSGFQVECIGPGKVDYLEECLDYEPRPMCCCVYELIPDMPHIPREISCDADCHALKEPKANDKVTGDL